MPSSVFSAASRAAGSWNPPGPPIMKPGPPRPCMKPGPNPGPAGCAIAMPMPPTAAATPAIASALPIFPIAVPFLLARRHVLRRRRTRRGRHLSPAFVTAAPMCRSLCQAARLPHLVTFSPCGTPRPSPMVPCVDTAPHILVVDDHREIRELVSRALTREGFRTTAVGDGKAMQRALADAHIDLILLDLMLPGEDGLSLCRRVRADSDVPISML